MSEILETDDSIDAWFKSVMGEELADESVGYLFYDQESGALIAITERFDETLAEKYAHVAIPREELDLMVAQEPKQANEGYIYYGGQWGDIRGVTLHPSDELADLYEHIRVSRDDAMKFMSGERPVDQWQVGYTAADRVTPRLLSRAENVRFVNLQIMDERFVEIPLTCPHVALSLTVQVPRNDKIVSFRVNKQPDMQIEFGTEIEDLTFLVTRRGDPSVVYEFIKVPLAELLSKGSYEAPVEADLTRDISVYTRRVFEFCNVEFTRYHFGDLAALPTGHFLDMVTFKRRLPEDVNASIVASIDREEGRIDLEFFKKGGRVFRRDLGMMPLIFTRPQDASVIYGGARVNLNDLYHRGTVTIPLPEVLAGTKFDIIAPLLFETMLVRDALN